MFENIKGIFHKKKNENVIEVDTLSLPPSAKTIHFRYNYYTLEVYFKDGDAIGYKNHYDCIDLRRLYYWYLFKKTRYYIFYSNKDNRPQERTFDREQIKYMMFLHPEFEKEDA